MPFTDYIKGANEVYARINFDPYHWMTNITSPWTPMTKKLSNCRVALVSGGGISLKSQTPYQLTSIGDLSYREIQGVALKEHYTQGDASLIGVELLPNFRWEQYSPVFWELDLSPERYIES